MRRTEVGVTVALLILFVRMSWAVFAGADAEPQLYGARISDLHPTQMAVGMREVDAKVEKLHPLTKHPEQLQEFLRTNPEPVVLGPAKERYIIDHHHLALALDRLGVDRCFYTLVADLSDRQEHEFWKAMEQHHWVYPYDEDGKGPHPFSDLPKTVEGLKDDPYRSLAQAVRKQGGYRKSDAPFAEFLWANFFRDRVKIHHNGEKFEKAVEEALALSHSRAAEEANLPGFSKTTVTDH